MLTDSDLAHCADVYADEISDALCDGTYDGPSVAMTSIGYVLVWADGEVTAHGAVVGAVEAL